MTDFQRLITVLPGEPRWTEPTPAQRQEVSEHAADLREGTRPPHAELRPEDIASLFNYQQRQFGSSDHQFFEAWARMYQGQANNTTAGIGYHQQATALFYLLMEDSVREGSAETVSGRLHQFNEQWGAHREDLLGSPYTPRQRASELNGILIPSALTLLQNVTRSSVSSDTAVAAELNTLASHVIEAYRSLIQVCEGQEDLSFLREFAQAQIEIFELRSPSEPFAFPEQLRRARSIQNHLTQARELARDLHLDEHSSLADDRTQVMALTEAQLQQFRVPSETELARNLITANTLLMVSTVGSEIDLMHREEEGVVNERYFRFSQAMETILGAHPEMNFRQAFDHLRNLRFSDRVYDRIAGSEYSVADAIAVLSGERRDDALRDRLRSLARHRGEPPLSDANLVAILRGTPEVRRMAPVLISNLINYIDTLQANDPNRQWLIDHFRATDPEINLSLAHEQLQMAWSSNQAPSNEVLDALTQGGAPAQALVEGFIRDRRREAEAQQTPFNIPSWLTELSHRHFERPATQTLQNVRADLVRVQQRLERGEVIREREDRTYDNLLVFFTNARDRDASHLQELFTDRNVLDEDQRFLNELIGLDEVPLTPQGIHWHDSSREPRTSDYVNTWAAQVLDRVDRHVNNFSEAFVHDNENHIASFRVIWSLIGGEGSGSLQGQLSHLTGATLNSTLRERSQRAERNTHTAGFRIETVWQNFAGAENLAFLGLMVGSNQAATRAITGSELVASGARVTIADLVQATATRIAGGRRWMAWFPSLATRIAGAAYRSPVTTALTTSVTAGLLYALGNDVARQRNSENSDFGHDFWVGTGVTLGLTSPLWFPRWLETAQSFSVVPRTFRNSSFLVRNAGRNERLLTLIGTPVLGGTAYAGFHRLTNPRSDLTQDFLLGGGITAAYLAPAILPRAPWVGSTLGNGMNGLGRGMRNLSVIAEDGQLGFAGHGSVALTTGLFTGALSAGLQAGRDRSGGYDTHFGHDLGTGTVTMGIGLGVSALMNSAIHRIFMRRLFSRFGPALESGEAITLTRSALREGGLMTFRTLLAASVATGGMLLGTAESRALSAGRFLPNGQDFNFQGEEIGITFANMLAFEMLNAGINRLTLRSTLGRPRATQIDHIVDRLIAGVELPSGENPETMRNFLWNRLALEALRGADLSPLADPERILGWQAAFRSVRPASASRVETASTPGTRGRVGSFARGLMDGWARTDLDSGIGAGTGSRRTRSGRYEIDLRPRSQPLAADEELATNVAAFSLLVVPQMVASRRATLPPQRFFVNADGLLSVTRPHGEATTAPLDIEFAGDRIYLSPAARRTIGRVVTSDEGRARLLALHGERITVSSIARATTHMIRDISTNPQIPSDVSLYYVRTNPNDLRAAEGGTPALPEGAVYLDENFTIYQGPLSNVPEERRGPNLFAEIVIPSLRTRSGLRGPMLRVRQGEGRFADLDPRLQALFAALPRSEGVSPTLRVQIASNSFEIPLPQVHLGERVTVTTEDFGRNRTNETVASRLPTDLRFILERNAENEWTLINDSETTVIRVGSRPIRPHQSTDLSARVRLTIPEARGSRTLQFEFRLPGEVSDGTPSSSGGSGGRTERGRGLGSGSSSSSSRSGGSSRETRPSDSSRTSPSESDSEAIEGEVIEVRDTTPPPPPARPRADEDHDTVVGALPRVEEGADRSGVIVDAAADPEPSSLPRVAEARLSDRSRIPLSRARDFAVFTIEGGSQVIVLPPLRGGDLAEIRAMGDLETLLPEHTYLVIRRLDDGSYRLENHGPNEITLFHNDIGIGVATRQNRAIEAGDILQIGDRELTFSPGLHDPESSPPSSPRGGDDNDPTPPTGNPSPGSGSPPGGPPNPPVEAAPSAPQSLTTTEGGATIAPTTRASGESRREVLERPTLRPPPSDEVVISRVFSVGRDSRPGRFLRFSFQAPNETVYQIDLPLYIDFSSGNWVGELGRDHFSFLEPGERRTISRRHARFSLTPQGQLFVEPLISQSGQVGERHGTGSDSEFPLSLPDTFYLRTSTEDLPLTIEGITE